MPSKINKTLAARAIIFLLACASLAGCSAAVDLDPTPTPIQSETSPTDQPVPKGLFDRYAVAGIKRDSALSVYQEPSAGSSVVGQIPSFGVDILPTGELRQDGNTTWMLINHRGTEGWVDLGFLAEQHGDLPEELIILGQTVLESLSERQYDQLIPYIHPDSCLRFSPYQYLAEENRILCPSEIEGYASSAEPLVWGHFDGSGEPIHLTFYEYHQKFVYDLDYLNPRVVGFNVEVSTGNSINNIQEIYPDGIMIEYYFPGVDPRYGGLDWRSLRLVFVPENDQWYLAAIIHGEWTI